MDETLTQNIHVLEAAGRHALLRVRIAINGVVDALSKQEQELDRIRDRAQDALTAYYANGDPAHLEDLAKELVR